MMHELEQQIAGQGFTDIAMVSDCVAGENTHRWERCDGWLRWAGVVQAEPVDSSQAFVHGHWLGDSATTTAGVTPSRTLSLPAPSAQACGSGGTTAGIALGNHLSGLGLRVHAYGTWAGLRGRHTACTCMRAAGAAACLAGGGRCLATWTGVRDAASATARRPRVAHSQVCVMTKHIFTNSWMGCWQGWEQEERWWARTRRACSGALGGRRHRRAAAAACTAAAAAGTDRLQYRWLQPATFATYLPLHQQHTPSACINQRLPSQGVAGQGRRPPAALLFPSRRAVQAKGAGYALSREDELALVADVAAATGIILDPV